MPRPRSLTEPRVAGAALTVVDREGLGELSMRAVAAELGVGTMSLYRYVKDRAALERLVVDSVLGAVDTALPTRASWSRQVTILAERICGAVGAHPAIVPLLMAHRHSARGVMRCAEAFLRPLTRAGFKGKQRAIALRMLVSYMIGALQAQHFGPLGGTGTAVLAQLRNSEYPLLAETARYARQISPSAEFRRGLAILLLGLRN